MTQADSATRALRRSLDSEPTRDQGQAEISVTTPLPAGRASFCSKPSRENAAHWYATAPWPVERLKEKHGEPAKELAQTVDAGTWVGLHKAVAEQVALHAGLTEGAA
jgi:hypothetical protein